MTTTWMESGSVIHPGNFGRVISLYAFNRVDPASAWRTASELIFEIVRRDSYPQLPSRLNSCFVFTELEHAQRCRAQMGFSDLIYEVEMVHPEMPSHMGAFNLITGRFPAEGQPFMPDQQKHAHLYWSGSHIEVPEVLTASPIRIVRPAQGENVEPFTKQHCQAITRLAS